MSEAVLISDGPDAGAPWHYGDPLAEQRSFDQGDGIVDLGHRPVISVSGPDRLQWLHTLTTQHLEQLPPRIWTQALILSPHGHIEHHLTLVDDGQRVLAHIEPGTAEQLLNYLNLMVFRSEVEVDEVTAEVAAVRTPVGDRFVDRDRLDEAMATARPVGLWAAEALRVAAGVPRLGWETDHRSIPHELGWLEATVHLDKGCYRGQETVARVHNLGRPPRRLVRLHLDGSSEELPARGSAVMAGDREIGFLGTAAQHYEEGPIALALIKRTVPVTEPLAVAGLSAQQEVLVAA